MLTVNVYVYFYFLPHPLMGFNLICGSEGAPHFYYCVACVFIINNDGFSLYFINSSF